MSKVVKQSKQKMTDEELIKWLEKRDFQRRQHAETMLGLVKIYIRQNVDPEDEIEVLELLRGKIVEIHQLKLKQFIEKRKLEKAEK